MYIRDRRSIHPARLLGFGAGVLLASLCGLQAQIDTGSIRGIVYDQTMAVIPDVTVTAVDEQRGVERETVSSRLGEYVFTLLEPGTYSVSFAAENFAPLTVEGFELLVGESSTFSPQLSLATADLEVVILADEARSAIEPERVQQSDHIDAVRIENLPINRRDYLDLALLTPGVVDTNYVAEDRDFRIAATPQSGLGIGGTNGRGNTFMIDGLDNTYNSGTVRSSISQIAVREFQVNRNSYSAEQGGAPGGTVNIVTKSGGNNVHGALFGTVRNRRFQARNFFDPGKAPYTRSQSGAGFGGPVEQNKTFYYAAYERLDRHGVPDRSATVGPLVPHFADPFATSAGGYAAGSRASLAAAARRPAVRRTHAWELPRKWCGCSRRTAACFRLASSASSCWSGWITRSATGTAFSSAATGRARIGRTPGSARSPLAAGDRMSVSRTSASRLATPG